MQTSRLIAVCRVLFVLSCVLHAWPERHCLAEKLPSLHQQIDQVLKRSPWGHVAGRAEDSELVRRAYLDLTGKIPPAQSVRDYVSDRAADKYPKLIDGLLDGDDFLWHMVDTLDRILMERRGDKHVKNKEWRNYLFDSLQAGKPWNRLAAEILAADGSDEKTRAAARFYLDREGETNLLTRDVGRIFFGMDLQCCQCHDHPLIDDYYQADYYGIFAFLNRSYMFEDKKAKKWFFVEKADGGVNFKSVFTEEQGRTRPRLPRGRQIDEPRFTPDEQYQVKPAKDVRPVPKFSRRGQLARLAAAGENPAFNRNIVNRLWAHLLGRGLVEPVDLHHSDNPPSHPELLQLLEAHFVSAGYDIKHLLRELALTQVYQQSSRVPENLQAVAERAAAASGTLQSERDQQLQAYLAAEELHSEVLERLQQARDEAEALHQRFADGQKQLVKATKAAAAARTGLNAANTRLQDHRTLVASLSVAGEKLLDAARQLEDEPLKSVVLTFQNRLSKFQAAEAQLAQTGRDKQAALTAATEALTAAQQQVEPIQSELDRTSQAIDTLWQTETERLLQRIAARCRHQSLEQCIELSEQLARYVDTVQVQRLAQREHQRLQTRLASARQARTKTDQQRQASSAALAAARQVLSAGEPKLARIENQLRQRRSASHALEAAAKSAQLASSQLPEDSDLAELAGRLSARADQLRQTVAALEASQNTQQALARQAENNVATTTGVIDQAETRTQQLDVAIAALVAELAPLTEQISDRQQDLDQQYSKLTGSLEDQFAVAGLRPLTPEQLCRSMMQATGALQQQLRSAVGEFEKKNPQVRGAAREQGIQQLYRGKVDSSVRQFTSVFGAEPGQPQHDFFATVDQALFLANGSLLHGWIGSGGGSLYTRLKSMDNVSELADELYLSILSRRPQTEEAEQLAKALANAPDDKSKLIQEWIWSLLTSAEFRFSH